MNKIIDPGHRYELLSIDGDLLQTLTFVKRCIPPQKYPGNHTAHPGTTLQSVIRCLLERLRYLQGQVWSVENWLVVRCLRVSLWLLEFRAARRHQHFYAHGIRFAVERPLCPVCGHTDCKHKLI